MKAKYLMGALLTMILAGGCSKETPFNSETVSGEGKFSRSAILLDVRDGDDMITQDTRAGELNDFKILFFKNNNPAPEASYMYAEMPDVVVLPVGKYTVKATKGTDVEAEWESPYFIGTSPEFDITEDEIASELDPIVCVLQNVKVSIDFAPMLSGNMSPDSYVEVKVGDNAGLQFTKSHEGMAGHFRHTEGVSLVATFHGEVEGLPRVETKSHDNVLKGHHYKITFKLDTQNSDHYGEADAAIAIDASVTTVDLEHNVEIGADEPLDDSERPTEGGSQTPPDDPNEKQAPQIEGEAPINIDQVNTITDGMSCVLNITSKAAGGFTKFTCDIESDKLTPDELAGVGLNAHLDLVNTPEDLKDALTGLGFPVEVGGQKEVIFNLTNFLPMLEALGPNEEHHFILTVGDANGETVKTLKLKTK